LSIFDKGISWDALNGAQENHWDWSLEENQQMRSRRTIWIAEMVGMMGIA
jgi:hypothetical protein